MRKLLWIMVALLSTAVCASYSHADSFTYGTLNFTVTSTVPLDLSVFTPTGAFAFDNTTNTLEFFTVSWNGAVFDFAPLFAGVDLAVLGEGGTWSAHGNIAPDTPHGVPPFFTLGEITDGVPEFPPSCGFSCFADGRAGNAGTYTVTEEVSTPEPSSFALILLGLGALLAARREREYFRERRLVSPAVA